MGWDRESGQGLSRWHSVERRTACGSPRSSWHGHCGKEGKCMCATDRGDGGEWGGMRVGDEVWWGDGVSLIFGCLVLVWFCFVSLYTAPWVKKVIIL